MAKAIIGHVYKHKKGNIYEVILIGLDTETGKHMIVYKSLKDGQIWIRSQHIFEEEGRFEDVTDSYIMFSKPKSEDFANYKENITVDIRFNGHCRITQIDLCPDKQITGNQSKLGNCGDCDYFMGYKSVKHKYSYSEVPACCWVIEQSKQNK